MERSSHENQMRRCAAEIELMLPELANRYPPLVMVAAFTEHVGGGLFMTQEVQVCSAEEARAIIQRVKEIGFAHYQNSAGAHAPPNGG